jgi:hypothetical protein
MATYILKRKVYTEPAQENKKSSFGKKLAVGAGVLGGTALAAYGAQRGVFGAKAQIGTNKALGNIGSSINKFGQKYNNKTLQKFGDNAMSTASVGYGKGNTSFALKRLQTNNPKKLTTGELTKKATAIGQRAGDIQLNRWLN